MKAAHTKKLGLGLCLGLSMFASMMGTACSPSKSPTNSVASATSNQPETKYETVDQALAEALMSSTVKNLPPAVKNRFEMEIKEFVASSQKQQTDGQSDEFNQKILHLATYIADGMSKRDLETEAEPDFMTKHIDKYQALAEKNVKLLNDQIQKRDLVAVNGMIQVLAASIDY